MIRTHRAPRAGENRARDGAPQVVVGVAVAARKMWAGEPENLSNPGGSPSLRQQVSGDPPIHDAPVWLSKAFADVPSLHTIPIDVASHRCGDDGWGGILRCRVGAGGSIRRRGPGRVQQCLGSRCQANLGVYDLHPGGVTAQCTARGFLVGEAGEPSEVTPVGAGLIASIGQRQQLAGSGRHRWFQGRGAEANPGLQMVKTGLQNHTRIVSPSAHGGDRCRLRTIQIDENIACVLVVGIGVNIDVASFAVARAQKPDGSGARQLLRRPKAFAWKRLPGLMRFAHTINITTPTAQASTNRAGLAGPLTCCPSATSLGAIEFRSGCRLSSCFPSIVNSACAPCTVPPGLSLPMTFIVFPMGFVLSVSGQGTKISIRVPGANTLPKSKDAGSTPTTVTGRLFKVSFRPNTLGSEAKRHRQKLYVKSMAGGAEYFPWHSSVVNDLPIAGCTPSNEKKFPVTGTLVRRSGSPVPVSCLSPTP